MRRHDDPSNAAHNAQKAGKVTEVAEKDKKISTDLF